MKDFSRFEPISPEESSALAKGLRYTAQLGAEAVKAPFKLAELPADIARAVLPDTSKNLPSYMQRGVPRVSEGVQQIADLGGEYKQMSKPGSTAEKFEKAGLYSAQALPFILSGGGTAAAKTGQAAIDYLGSLGKSYVEDWTDSPVTGMVADLLIQNNLEKGANALKNLVMKTNKLKDVEKGISNIKSPKVDKHISDMYEKSDALAKKELAPADLKEGMQQGFQGIMDRLNKFAEYPSEVFTKSAAKDARTGIGNAQSFAQRQKLSLFDIVEKERDLNRQIKDLMKKKPSGSIGIDYLKDVKKVFTDTLNKASEKFPEFGKYYNNSKKLYQTDKWQSNLGKWANDASKKGIIDKVVPNKWAQLIISGLSGWGAGMPGAIATGVAYPLAKAGVVKGAAEANKFAQGSQFAWYMSQTPEGLNLIKDIIINSAKNNIPILIKDLKKLNSMADEFKPKDFSRFESV